MPHSTNFGGHESKTVSDFEDRPEQPAARVARYGLAPKWTSLRDSTVTNPQGFEITGNHHLRSNAAVCWHDWRGTIARHLKPFRVLKSMKTKKKTGEQRYIPRAAVEVRSNNSIPSSGSSSVTSLLSGEGDPPIGMDVQG